MNIAQHGLLFYTGEEEAEKEEERVAVLPEMGRYLKRFDMNTN